MLTLFSFLMQVLKAVAIALVGHWAITTYAERLVVKLTAKMNLSRNIQTILVMGAKFGLYFVLITTVCPMIGISNSTLVTLLGTVGAAAALAFQGSLSALIGGVTLMVNDAFAVGDFVEGAGQSGTVVKIGLFYTELVTADNHIIYVPNNSLTAATIHNYSRKDTRRLDLDIGVPYSCKLEEARNVVMEVLKADGRVMADPAPFVATWDLKDSCVNLKVRVWCASGDYWDLRSHLLETIKETLDEKNMSIPFNIIDVNVYNQK